MLLRDGRRLAARDLDEIGGGALDLGADAPVKDGHKLLFHADRAAPASDIPGDLVDVGYMDHRHALDTGGLGGLFQVQLGQHGHDKHIIVMVCPLGDQRFKNAGRVLAGQAGDVIFEMCGVTLPGSTRVCGVSDVNLAVRAGEIVGIAGISGNGQARFMAAAAGEAATPPDCVKLFGKPVGNLDTHARRISGLRYVPEQRLGHAAVPELSLTANTYLTGDSLVRSGFILRDKARQFANTVIERFHVKTPTAEKAAGSLSGGNLQKFIMGREILNRPRVLLVHQPTWGVDVGAAAVIRNSLIRLRDDGAAIIVVSEEIDELFEVSDRIAVMYRGALSPAVPKKTLTIEEVGRWMSGLWPDSPFSKTHTEVR